MNRRLAMLVVCSGLLLGAMGLAHAGYVVDPAGCTFNGNGSGSCSGSYAGFRNLSNPGDFAEFYVTTSQTLGFSVVYGGVSKMCVVNANTVPSYVAAAAASSHSFFVVTWDTNATCTSVSIYNGSWTTTK